MTHFVTLHPVSGMEIARREMRRIDALHALTYHQLEGGAGYVQTNGRIIAFARCRDLGSFVPFEGPATEHAMKRLGQEAIWDWGNARLNR